MCADYFTEFYKFSPFVPFCFKWKRVEALNFGMSNSVEIYVKVIFYIYVLKFTFTHLEIRITYVLCQAFLSPFIERHNGNPLTPGVH